VRDVLEGGCEDISSKAETKVDDFNSIGAPGRSSQSQPTTYQNAVGPEYPAIVPLAEEMFQIRGPPAYRANLHCLVGGAAI